MVAVRKRKLQRTLRRRSGSGLQGRVQRCFVVGYGKAAPSYMAGAPFRAKKIARMARNQVTMPCVTALQRFAAWGTSFAAWGSALRTWVRHGAGLGSLAGVKIARAFQLAAWAPGAIFAHALSRLRFGARPRAWKSGCWNFRYVSCRPRCGACARAASLTGRWRDDATA